MKVRCRSGCLGSLLVAHYLLCFCEGHNGATGQDTGPDSSDDRTVGKLEGEGKKPGSGATEALLPFDQAYRKGKEAYLENNWPECVARITEALLSHRQLRQEVVRCRRRCHREAKEAPLLVPGGPLAFYEEAIRDTLCLMRCQRQPAADRRAAAALRAIDDEIQQRTPYDYLQLCHFKINDLQNAASSAYTFLLHNPDHEVMKTNFQFYASQPEVDHKRIENLEVLPYQDLYLKGNEAYNKKNYQEVAKVFEDALRRYYKEEEDCRLLCEGHFEQAPALDLTMTIANHFTYSLRCKQRCPQTLGFLYGEEYPDFLPSHYHYLQYAYYQIGEMRKACEAVASYLLFHPTNEAMLHNKEYYGTSQPGITAEHFTPRKEVADYVQRDNQEKLLLEFVKENFMPPTSMEPIHETYGNQTANVTVASPPDGPNTDSQHLLTEEQLNGTDRFAADGFINRDECEHLVDLAAEAAIHGDGYNGKSTPHTKFETFEGLTVGRAALLVKLGHLKKEHVKLFLDISEQSRRYVENYFRLKAHSLYFSYTHLVCRTANPDSPANRSDLSHPVHADNCVLTKDGKCLKDKPAFTWRDYSSILYLNDDFDGGDFIFADNKDSIQASIRPKCGRMVGFSAGQENLHGVQAVVRGRRCALAMWFTLDHDHREKERFLAIQVIDQLEREEKGLPAADEQGKTDSATGRGAAAPLDGTGDEDLRSDMDVYQLETNRGYSEVQLGHEDL